MASSNSPVLLLPNPAPGQTNLGDIQGIKGPVEIPSSLHWLLWAAVALAAVALSLWLWRRFRRRRPSAAPAVIIPPHRRAKDRLRSAEGMMSDPYAFCSLVSDVTRTYLEERFDLHAPDRTTEEFLDELRASPALLPEHKSLLELFLSQCDLVKFARAEPAEPELRALLDAALRLIDETSPLGESPASPRQEAA